MKKEFQPLVAARLVVLGRKTVFHLNNKEVVLEAPRALVKQLVLLCDGKRSLNQILLHLKTNWDEASVRELVVALRYYRVLIDGSRAGEEAWELVRSPIGYPPFLSNKEKANLVEKAKQRHYKREVDCVHRAQTSPHGDLLKRRRSIRSFSGEVSLQSIINMLWSAYGEIGEGRRVVPSAGALYPLMIHVVFLRGVGDLSRGIYSVCFGLPESVGLHFVSEDVDRFQRSFLDPMMFVGACGVIVISGSFRVAAEKYGSRSMLFVPLEAGHAAQNINISAVEQSVATVEVGGFKESLLAESINLPNSYCPLITTVFGREGKLTGPTSLPLGKEGSIQWAMPVSGRYHPPFSIVSARVSKGRSWSHGRDASPHLAYVKAVSEAREWASCGNVPNDLMRAAFVDLEGALDPRSVIRFHPTQYHLSWFPFAPFDEEREYEWTKGQSEITASTVYTLADLVYFPYFPKTPYYSYANSSGVAAYPDKRKAIETSALELVERDSFMIAYLSRIQFPTVYKRSLPESIRRRLKELQKAGFRVWIKNHSLDLAPVVFVFAQNEDLGCTTCASCASFDVEHATSHALMEVEAFVLDRLQRTTVEKVKPTEVEAPVDHGKLYDQKRYFRRADFLIEGSSAVSFGKIGDRVARSWQELLDRISMRGWDLITVPLRLADKYGGSNDLHIVRSIIPGVIPMTFGFRQEPAGMERIYVIGSEFGGKKVSYRDLTKFPHPFA